MNGRLASPSVPEGWSFAKKQLWEFYWRAERIIAPGLRSSQCAYYEKVRDAVNETSRWLDLGCGHHVFGAWMDVQQQEVLNRSRFVAGIDLDWNALLAHRGISRRIFGNLESLPVRSESLDVITANMVLEHVEHPEQLLREVYRVLGGGGVFIFHTPNYYHWGTLAAVHVPSRLKHAAIRMLDGRGEDDVFATYYRFNSAAAIRELASRVGFEVMALDLVSTSATLAALGPVALPELLYIRLLQHPSAANLRSNLVVTLRKPALRGGARPS